MKKKFLMIGLAMGSLVFSQNTNELSEFIALPDTTQVNVVTVPTKNEAKKITSVQCSGTSKSTNNRCKLRTRHESKYCHHHRN